MKRNSLLRIPATLALFALLLGVLAARAGGGPAFRELQNVKLPFTPSIQWYNHTGDFMFFLCSTKTDMLMFDGTTGKILWQKNFEKDFGNKKFSNQFWNKSANVVLVYDEDTKKGIATKYFIDGKTGALLWSSDKYVSDLGDYELSNGFTQYFNETTGGVLLPTKQSVDLVEVRTGKTIWSKPVTLQGKAKDFDCFIMKYYDLVKIILDEDHTLFLTIGEGREVTDVESYFNQKKYLADRQHAKLLAIPEKDMYVLMIAETNRFFSAFTGIDLPGMKMTFKGFNAKTDALLWTKQYSVHAEFDWVSRDDYFARMYFDGTNLFVEHNPSPKPNTGLTVLNPDNGEFLWEAWYRASERKTAGLRKTLVTPFPAPDPVTMNGKTYVVNKAKNIVSCYESATGKKVWDSEEFPDAQKIPKLFYSDDLIIMVHGGDALKCASITQDKGPSLERYEYNNKDKYGIIAYSAATGKVIWSNETIEKKVKDKFSLIAGAEMIDGKLVCATNKNFLVLDPKNGDLVSSVPVSREKLGDAWKMYHFEKEGKLVLNCEDGIIKLDPASRKVTGTLETPTFPFYQASKFMNADDPYQDYAVCTKGDGEKMTVKEFAAIDLDKMTIRGVEDGELLFKNNPHFSEGAEMFFKIDGEKISFYSVK